MFNQTENTLNLIERESNKNPQLPCYIATCIIIEIKIALQIRIVILPLLVHAGI